jgi:hypothetical protein
MSYSFLNQEKMTTQTGALSKAVDIIKKCINQNQYILGVFCDTRKKVDRSKLPVLKMSFFPFSHTARLYGGMRFKTNHQTQTT